MQDDYVNADDIMDTEDSPVMETETRQEEIEMRQPEQYDIGTWVMIGVMVAAVASAISVGVRVALDILRQHDWIK